MDLIKTNLNDLGVSLASQGKYNEAIQTFKQALSDNPDSYDANFNMGMVLQLIGRNEKAIRSFENAIKINPQILDAHIFLYYQYRKFCRWDRISNLDNKIDELSKGNDNRIKGYGETPIRNLVRIDNPKVNFKTVRVFSQEIARSFADIKKNLDFSYRKKGGKKIRLGYFSSQLRDHPVGHLVSSIFEHHDREKFDVYVYSTGIDDNSIWRKRAEAGCDKFIDVAGINAVEIAKRMNKDEVDILVDLIGYSDETMLGVSALRPAPIIVTYLGYPGSTGADFIDYAIVDKIIVPPFQRENYSEKLIYLPCYQAQGYFDIDRPKSETDNNEPGEVIFCSFNPSVKITPEMYKTWMNILIKVPNSILWLYEDFEEVKLNLSREAQRVGIAWRRLVFHKRVGLAKHLQRISRADIALDTFHYNGGATTSNMLYAGVPVVTMQGKNYISRMSSSLLTAAGIPEMITHSFKEYEKLAVELATDREKLKRIKKKLLTGVKAKNLFDAKRFVINLEKQYWKVWKHWSN
jgi:protein O-GlcNAc transferase